jgi:hypothetical protein
MTTRLATDTARLIATHGRSVSFARTNSGGAYNTKTGVVSGGSTVTYSGTGIFLQYRANEVDGTNVRADDRRLLLSPAGLAQTPTIGDIVDGDMRIIDIRTVMSGTTVLHYSCQIRG